MAPFFMLKKRTEGDFMKGIDVSTFNGTIDWKKAKNDGVDFAILKVISKKNVADAQFENNWKGCTDAGVTIQGVYNYSYATSVTKAKDDANAVLKVLNGRKPMVWLDVEDSVLTGLGSRLIDIIIAYKGIINGAGLDFGVYTGLSFYKSYILPYYAVLLDIPFWIARYPSSAQKTLANNPGTLYKPVIKNMLYGWQWSSKGKVAGISGNVDLNVWYVDIQSKASASETITANSNAYVLIGQQAVNKFVSGANLVADGVFDDEDRKACVKVLQTALNKDYASGLKVDGSLGPLTLKALGSHYVKKGEKQYMVTALEILLYLNGYDAGGIEYPGSFGSKLQTAVTNFNKKSGISGNVATSLTFKCLVQ